MSQQTTPTPERRFGPATALLLVVPLALLAGVIFLFLSTGGGLKLSAPVPVEDLTVERAVLEPGSIDLVVRNAGPGELTIAQVVVNDGIRMMDVSPGPTIPRLGTATIHIPYGWVTGEAYSLTIYTTNALAFQAEIPVAFTTPRPGARTFGGFTLIGLYVGVIPVFLGIFWFPALRRLDRRWMVFLMALTAGLLIFLGLDTLAEAIEKVAAVPGPLQGVGLIGIGAVGAFLLLDAIAQRQTAVGRSEAQQRLALAFMIATGIGLHNLGEGLAIGAAYNLGEIALGAFLVVGFIVQNITEGLGIIAPVLRDRPRVAQLALMGLLGGGPAIVGAWVGGFVPSPTLAVLFLGIGAGAIFEVVYEVAKLVRDDPARRPLLVFSGVLSGMLLLWVTGLLIK